MSKPKLGEAGEFPESLLAAIPLATGWGKGTCTPQQESQVKGLFGMTSARHDMQY